MADDFLNSLVVRADAITNGQSGDEFLIKRGNQCYRVPTGSEYQNRVTIKGVNDFPDPVNGVITLADSTAYLIDGDVDIGANRLVGGINTAIIGHTTEISYLHNDVNSQALITSDETLTLHDITLYVEGTGATILDLDGSTSEQSNTALDWQFVNFSGGDVGTIKDYDNAILNTIGFIDKSGDGFPALGNGLTFDGSFGTIALDDTLFVVSGSGNTAINLPETLTITRRIRITDSSFVVTSSAVGINASASATIPDEGYILQNINFSGGATYLSGLDYTSDKARFEGCRGVVNTYAAANYTMNGNSTATVIAATGTPVKVAGTTVLNAITQKFTHSNNRATYSAVLQRTYKIDATLSLTSGNGHQIGIYIAKNGTVINESETYITTNASGRLENGYVQTLEALNLDDYIEVWVENNTSITNITVEDLNVTVTEI